MIPELVELALALPLAKFSSIRRQLLRLVSRRVLHKNLQGLFRGEDSRFVFRLDGSNSHALRRDGNNQIRHPRFRRMVDRGLGFVLALRHAQTPLQLAFPLAWAAIRSKRERDVSYDRVVS